MTTIHSQDSRWSWKAKITILRSKMKQCIYLHSLEQRMEWVHICLSIHYICIPIIIIMRSIGHIRYINPTYNVSDILFVVCGWIQLFIGWTLILMMHQASAYRFEWWILKFHWFYHFRSMFVKAIMIILNVITRTSFEARIR